VFQGPELEGVVLAPLHQAAELYSLLDSCHQPNGLTATNQ